VANWAAYNASRRQRGSLTLWFSEDEPPGLAENLQLRQAGKGRSGDPTIETGDRQQSIFTYERTAGS
jgi:hypothetical protein